MTPPFVRWDNGKVTHIWYATGGNMPAVSLCGGGGDPHACRVSYNLHGRPLCRRCEAAAIRWSMYWQRLADGIAP